MTVCPIAIVTGCQKCPVFKACPLKTVIGNMPRSQPASPNSQRAKPTKK